MLSLSKTFVLLAACAAIAGLGAVTTASAANAQQQKMKTCNAQAHSQSLAGTARRDFMKTCLSKHEAATASHEKHGSTAASHNRQREKMRACSADAKAKALKGSARRSFMSTCLKG